MTHQLTNIKSNEVPKFFALPNILYTADISVTKPRQILVLQGQWMVIRLEPFDNSTVVLHMKSVGQGTEFQAYLMRRGAKRAWNAARFEYADIGIVNTNVSVVSVAKPILRLHQFLRA